MATYIVSSGVTSTGITLNHGDFLGVSAGGTASDITANNGGTEFVYAGGTAVSTTLDSGGTEFAIGGGATSFTTISSGGAEGVYAGGTANGTTVSSGGYLIVLPGGSQSGSMLSGGTIVSTGVVFYRAGSGFTVYGPATTGLVVSTSGVEFVLSGGTAVSTTVDGGYEDVSGTSISATVNSGYEVVSDGRASDTTVNSQGIENVYSGGTVVRTTVDGGNEVVFGGTTSDTTVNPGGTEYVYSGGSAVSTTLNSGGYEVVSRATATDTTVNMGGVEDVYSGATAFDTTVNSSGYEVLSGGTTSDTTVNNGGTVFVDVGMDLGPTVGSGGYEVVSAGGTVGGNITVDGTLAASDGLVIGHSGNSSALIAVGSGGTVTDSGGFIIGDNGDGALTMIGAGSQLTARGEMQVGLGGTGRLSIENQATAITGAGTLMVGFDVGTQAGASGVVTVTGDQALLLNTGEFIVGDDGLGSLSIQSGATVATSLGTVSVPAGAVIAAQSNAAGSFVNVVGAGSDWQVGGALIVGNAGEGALNITAGGTVSAATIDLGADANSAGDLSVSGDNSDLVVTGSLAVGDLGSGDFSVLGSANAFIGGDLDFGQGSGGSGVVDLETTGTVTVNGGLNFGAGGPGVLTLGPNTDLVLSGGINGGPGGQLNLFTTIDPAPYSINSTDNISGAFKPLQTQDYPAYVAATAFNLSHGVTYTLDTPVIYAASSFTIAGSGDTTANTLILNTDSLSGDSSITFNNARGTLVIGSDQLGTIDVPATGTGPFTTEANPNLGRLLLGDFDGTIGGFQSGDQILVDTGLASASDGTLSVNGALVSVVDVANGDTLGVLTFVSSTQAAAAIAANAITQLVPCFAAGTRIATARGEVAVEDVRVGEQVRVLLGGGAAGDGLAQVVWVGRREVDCAGHATPRKVWPVRVAAGAFGPGQPHTNLYLSPDHAVYVEGVLIPVRCLVGGSTIRQVSVDRVVYHHVELEQHDVLLAEGLPAESFLDMRDGSSYANRSGPVRLYPDYSPRMWEAFGCAPLIVTGSELDAARALVATFAAEREAA